MKQMVAAAPVALMLASPASASQWWTVDDGPPEDCRVAEFDHGHSPAERFDYQRTIGNDPELLEPSPGAVGVEATTSGGRSVVAFFRTIELCQVFLRRVRLLNQYR